MHKGLSLSIFFCRLTESFPLAALGRAKDTNYKKKKLSKKNFFGKQFRDHYKHAF